jgi:small conductance mechanosensitive channel
MILVENQYSVGNVVRIGDKTGTVEDITLRMTSIRDLEGVVHFIPHSQVFTVSNMTYGWSRIVLDIRLAPTQDVDAAMRIILATARELKADKDFGPYIMADPDMLGVDSISAAAVVVKLLIKTRPLRRWVVKREFLHRLKKRFDEAGVKVA